MVKCTLKTFGANVMPQNGFLESFITIFLTQYAVLSVGSGQLEPLVYIKFVEKTKLSTKAIIIITMFYNACLSTWVG